MEEQKIPIGGHKFCDPALVYRWTLPFMDQIHFFRRFSGHNLR